MLRVRVEVTGTWEKRSLHSYISRLKQLKTTIIFDTHFYLSLWNRFVHVPVVEEPGIEARMQEYLNQTCLPQILLLLLWI